MLPERKKRVLKVTLEGHLKIDNFHFHFHQEYIRTVEYEKSKLGGIPDTRSDTEEHKNYSIRFVFGRGD